MAYFIPLAAINLLLIFSAGIAALMKWKWLDISARILCILVWITLIEESLAAFAAIHSGNNLLILRFFSLIESAFIALYFNYSIGWFRRYRLGYVLAIVSFIVWMTDFHYLKGLRHLSGRYMYYEGTMIITLSIVAMVQPLRSASYVNLSNNPRFQIAAALLLFWSFTIMAFACYNSFAHLPKLITSAFSYCLCIINYVFYSSLAVIFFRYPKIYNSDV
jgi:hypothetical protein